MPYNWVTACLRLLLLAFAASVPTALQAQENFGFFQKVASTQCSVLNLGGCVVTFPAVPAQKALKIEYVSCTIEVPSSGLSITSVALSWTGGLPFATLPFSPPVPVLGGKRSIVAEALTFIVVAGKTPRVGAGMNGVGLGKLNCTIVGRLLDPVS